MKQREQITRGRLRAKINIEPIEDGRVCIFCPTQVSDRLYQHLAAKHISSLPPKHAIFGIYSEVIVMLSEEEASVEVGEFVGSLPEVCYEQDVE